MFNKILKIKTIIDIEGMECDNCAKRVKNSLLALKDIKSVNVNLPTGKVEITSTKKLDCDKIKEVIDGLGYKLIKINND